MKSILARVLLVGFFAMSYMACSSGGPTPPPEPTYKYFAYIAHYSVYDTIGEVSEWSIDPDTGRLNIFNSRPAGSYAHFCRV
jgi:hypothetical protein